MTFLAQAYFKSKGSSRSESPISVGQFNPRFITHPQIRSHRRWNSSAA
jgi:hypothetical protein